MVLKEALQGFKGYRFYQLCGYKYRGLSHGGHGNMKYSELPERMQHGILEMLSGVYRVQKMVYDYDLDYVSHHMKIWGISLKEFYDGCNINKTFYNNRSLRVDKDKRLMIVRLHLIYIIIRLFDYVLE